jgi:glutamate 5-kinase
MKEEDKLDAERRRRLHAARSVVVKLGTSTVTGPEGNLCTDRVEPIVASIAGLMRAGRRVVLVSSGAVGLGRAWLGLHPSRLGDLTAKQACAAVGQSLLMDAYKRQFAVWDIKVAQILLTEEDFTNWRRYSNLRHTMEKLLQMGVIPIVNENDTVSTAELAMVKAGPRATVFSDNDRLAALVMSGLEADALVLLTNVNGLLRSGPSVSRDAGSGTEAIPLVDEITPELKALAAGPSMSGRGGMVTKLEAAQIAMHCGGIAVIANSQRPQVLDRVFAGEQIGTTFLSLQRMRGKRRWIAFAAGVQGRIVVDDGAQQAIEQGKASLLTSGVVRVESHFDARDVISIVDRNGRELARGLANCASPEVEDLLKKQGSTGGSKSNRAHIVVRRDNIVLVQR